MVPDQAYCSYVHSLTVCGFAYVKLMHILSYMFVGIFMLKQYLICGKGNY